MIDMTPSRSLSIVRQMWTRFEPIHAVTYFAPEARDAYLDAGLRGYWRGYFAGRCAPLGPIDAAPVIAMFFGFAPSMVRRALPDVWTRATPDETLAARRIGAEAALLRLAVDAEPDALAEAADLAEAAVDGLEPEGRPLGSANLSVPRDAGASTLARIWQAATTLREHRGDGHVAALVTYGFTGCESVVWRAGDRHRGEMQDYRGWTDEEWDGAVESLMDRGWLRPDGTHTPDGADAYAAVEAATDRAAMRVWTALGADRTEKLRDLLTPLAVAAYTSIPSLNPVGVPHPTGGPPAR
jgi:hypothetical protein